MVLLTSRGHIRPETEPRDIDQQVVRTEIVENVALGLVGEYNVASHGHEQAADQTHASGCVCDFVETRIDVSCHLPSLGQLTHRSRVGVSML